MNIQDYFRKTVQKTKIPDAENLKHQLIFILVSGLLMGTILIFGMNYWEAPITRSQAISKRVTYKSYIASYEDTSTIKEIILRFSDAGQMTIDGTCASETLLVQIDRFESGTVLDIIKHPNSDTILELVHDGNVLLGFDDAQRKLHGKVVGFTVLGLILYAFSVFAAIMLFWNKTQGDQ